MARQRAAEAILIVGKGGVARGAAIVGKGAPGAVIAGKGAPGAAVVGGSVTPGVAIIGRGSPPVAAGGGPPLVAAEAAHVALRASALVTMGQLDARHDFRLVRGEVQKGHHLTIHRFKGLTFVSSGIKRARQVTAPTG